jgi:hypothetical protein
MAAKSQTMGKAATPFAVLAARWQEEILVHKKASTAATVKGHINPFAHPGVWKAASFLCNLEISELVLGTMHINIVDSLMAPVNFIAASISSVPALSGQSEG